MLIRSSIKLGVYANAEKVVLAHASALKRAQRGDVIAAIAAKDAQAAAAAANGATAAAKALRENATPKQHPKSAKRLDLRGDITSRDGKQYIFCKGLIDLSRVWKKTFENIQHMKSQKM